MRFLTVLLLCLLLPEIATAAVFTPPPTDKSVSLLGIIFGTHMGPIYLGGPPNPALKHMFEIFNAVVISLGTIIISYIGLVSTVNTAQEGKAMGKKWNSIWIPLRATLGMVFIIPTPGSGYSIIQTSVMWLILQGIGAADSIWNGILGDLGSGISATTGIQNQNNRKNELHDTPPIYSQLRDTGNDLADDSLRSAVCAAVLQNIASGKATVDFNFKAPADSIAARHGRLVRWYSVRDANVVSTEDLATVSGTAYVGVPGDPRFYDVCGSYHVTASVERDEWDRVDRERINEKQLLEQANFIYSIKINALNKMFYNLKPLADEIAAQGPQLKPRHPHTNRLHAPIEGDIIEPAGYRRLAVNTYSLEMQHAIRPHKVAGFQQVIRQGVLNGWISAGSFFFVLNQTTDVDYFATVTDEPRVEHIPKCNNRVQCSQTFPTESNILGEKLNDYLEDYSERAFLATRLWDAKVYLENDDATVAEEMEATPEGTAINILQHRTSVLIRDMMNEQHSDPLLAQGKFGTALMTSAETTWSDTLAKQEVEIDRLAAEERPLTAAERARLEGLNTHNALILSLCAIIWGIGAMLAIYIPLIPYLMFTIAAVGWFLMVIEAIVAAPILAVSFMLPSGEELGKIMQGLMLILNIVLRPTLMLFGFILATRLYQAVVQLVNFSIVGNLDNLDVGESLYAWLAIIAIYGAFTVSLANKSFSLIYALPDKILRWMGGGAEHTDSSQEMHAVKGGIGKGEEIGKQISSGFIKRDLVRLDSRAKELGAAADEVTGGTKKG